MLSTAWVLSEGVDLPTATTCLYVEPRGSAIDVVQTVGRVLRLAPGKPLAYVVLPTWDERAELARFVRLLCAGDRRLRGRLGPGRLGAASIRMVAEKIGAGDAQLLETQIYACFIKWSSGTWAMRLNSSKIM